MINEKLISFLEKILSLSPGQQDVAIDILDDYFEEIRADVSSPSLKYPGDMTPEEKTESLQKLREWVQAWPDDES